MAVTDTYYLPNKDNPKVIVDICDDFCKNCNAEEIEYRKKEFGKACLKLHENIMKKKCTAEKSE